MAKLYNLARMTTTTTGTGTITLGSAVAGYLTFAQAGVANGDVVDYAIKDGNDSEIGTGTYTSSGTTLTRTVTKSTNSNAAINLSGAAEVFITPRAETLNDASLLTTGTVGTARLGSGTANSGTFLRGDSSWAAVTVPTEASQADMEAATASAVYVSPRRVISSPYAAKAWVVFAGSTGTVITSFGVSSVTRSATGKYLVNFSTNFSSANYGVAAIAAKWDSNDDANTAVTVGNTVRVPSASSCPLTTGDHSNFNKDPLAVYAVFFGDQ